MGSIPSGGTKPEHSATAEQAAYIRQVQGSNPCVPTRIPPTSGRPGLQIKSLCSGPECRFNFCAPARHEGLILCVLAESNFSRRF